MMSQKCNNNKYDKTLLFVKLWNEINKREYTFYVITQITIEMVEEILTIIKNEGISEIEQTTEAISSVLKKKTLEILSATIEEADSAILSAKRKGR